MLLLVTIIYLKQIKPGTQTVLNEDLSEEEIEKSINLKVINYRPLDIGSKY